MPGSRIRRPRPRRRPSVAPLSSADEGAIAFLGDRKFAAALAATKAGCVIVSAEAVSSAPADAAVIVARSPQAAWAQASLLLHRPLTLDRAITAAEAAEDELSEVSRLVKAEMEGVLGLSVPIVVNLKTGESWNNVELTH